MKPTVVLVHGAFADSSSWNGVAERLSEEGHRAVAFAVPLRGIATDSALLDDLLRSIEGPVVLVAAAVAVGAELVPVRRAGPQHPGWRPPDHGPASAGPRTVEIAGASHVVGISHAYETAAIILDAAGAEALART